METLSDSIFYNCVSLTSITIPDSITDIVIPSKINYVNIVGIADGAFANTPITSVVIPDSVETIGAGAFKDCANLANVTIYGKEITFGEDVFQSSPVATIYDYADSNIKTYVGETTTFVSFESLQTQVSELLTALGDEKYAPLNIYADIQTALTTYANIANSADISELNNAITSLSTLNTNAENALIISDKQGSLATLVAALKVYSDPKYADFLATTDFDIDTIVKGFEAYLTSNDLTELEEQISTIESEIFKIETAYSEYIASSTTTTTSTTTSTTSSTSSTTSTTYVLLEGDYSDVDFSTAKLANMKNHENFVKLEYSN